MKLILTFCVLVLLVFGGIIALAHHDTVERADRAYKNFAPATASFSRLRGDKNHLVSVYWRLHFPRKKQPMREMVAFWSLRPFRHVTLDFKK